VVDPSQPAYTKILQRSELGNSRKELLKSVTGRDAEKDERISLVDPDARSWMRQKTKTKAGEAMLGRFEDGFKDHENFKVAIEELETRKGNLEDWIGKLQSKSNELELEDLEKSKRLGSVKAQEKIVLDELFAKEVYFETYQAFANEISNKTNNLVQELNEKNEIISELNKKEWIKAYERELKEILHLRSSLVEKNQEINDLKKEIRQGPQYTIFLTKNKIGSIQTTTTVRKQSTWRTS
jgi:hypothetical protein